MKIVCFHFFRCGFAVSVGSPLRLVRLAGLGLLLGAATHSQSGITYELDERIPPYYHFTLGGEDFDDDPLGGPGLDPPRKYYVVFDGSPVALQSGTR